MGWWDWLFKSISGFSASAPKESVTIYSGATNAGPVALDTAPADSAIEESDRDAEPWWVPRDQALLDPITVNPAGLKQPTQYLENVLVSHFDGHNLSMPQLNNKAEQILPKLRSDLCDLKAIGREIGEDQILSAAVLRTANSPMYRGVENISTVPAAVTRIGIKSLRTLLLHQSVRSAIFARNTLTRQFANDLWRKSLGDGCIMRGLGGLMRMDEEDCHLIGVMHDIGSVLVLRIINDEIKNGHPAIHPRLFEYLRRQTHQEFGELIAKAWKLPEDLTRLIMNHHTYPKPGEALATQRWMLSLTEMIGGMLYSDEPASYDLIQCRPALELGLSSRLEYHDWLCNVPAQIEQALLASDA